jgi:hypothetical protein
MISKSITNLSKYSFSLAKSFYQTAVLDASISLNDTILKQNKASMDQVNSHYLDILTKVTNFIYNSTDNSQA